MSADELRPYTVHIDKVRGHCMITSTTPNGQGLSSVSLGPDIHMSGHAILDPSGAEAFALYLTEWAASARASQAS